MRSRRNSSSKEHRAASLTAAAITAVKPPLQQHKATEEGQAILPVRETWFVLLVSKTASKAVGWEGWKGACD
jgi:hypothetical protein